MSKNITQRLSGVVAVLASIAMLFCVLPLPAQAADAADGVGADATADANVYQALKYMQELNALRARTDRRKLTAQQIADAQNADHSTTKYKASDFAANTADGKAVGALKVNSDMMKWTQTRANELAKRAETNENSPIGHEDMYNGKPGWYACEQTSYPQCTQGSGYNLTEADGYVNGTIFFGPEALAIGYPEYSDAMNPVNAWYSELNVENNLSEVRKNNPQYANMTDAQILQYERQGYGHYLTEVSPLADIAGFGVAKVTSGRWKGATISVLEIGNSKSAQGTTQSVEDAIKKYEPKTTYTVKFESNGGSTIATQTVESGSAAAEPTAPTKDGYTFGGWYSDVQLTNKYNFSTPVTGNITLYAKWDAVTITSLDPAGTISTPAGVDPTDQLPKQVTARYSDGSSKLVDVTWNPISKSDYANPDTSFTVNGTVNGTDIKAQVTVNVTAAVPQSAAVTPTTVPTIATHAPSLPQQATVTYSDGTTQNVAVTWDTVTSDQYATPNADGFDVNGTVAVDGYTFTVTVKVIVTARTIESVTAPADQTVESGIEPAYPDTVAVTYNDGETGTANVTWTKLTKDQYGKRDGGTFTVNGTVDGYAKGVSFKVTVNPATVKSVEPSATTVQTVVGETPDLSGIKATVTYSNGDTETKDIEWPQLTKDQFAKVGDTVTVKGSVTVDGTKHDVTVTVTVVDATVTKVESPQPAAGADANVTVDSGTSPETALNALKATVTWSNGTTTEESVNWDEPNEADYTNRKGGTFTVNGTVTIAGKDYKVTATYKVNPAVAQKAELAADDATIAVPSGTDPTGKLPKTATVTWSNGDTTTSPITWSKTYTKADYSKREGNTFTVNGTVDPTVESAAAADSSKVIVAKAVEVSTLSVAVAVTVTPATITKVADIPAVTTEANVAPQLPASVKTDWSNGETGVDTPITWDAIDASKYAKRGEFTVNGKATDAATGATADVKVTVKVTAKAESAAKLADVTVDSGTDPASALPKTVKVTYTDGVTEDAAITWDTTSYTKADYSKREGNTFAVKGKAAGLDVTVTVKVNPATVKSVDTTAVTVGTKVGVQPDLPKTTTVTWSNGDVENVAITWPEIPADKLDQAGSFEIEGVVTAGGKDYTIKATITVKEAEKVTVTSVERDVKVSTTEGTAPALPKTVKAHWSDGSTTDAAVVWGDVPAAKYAKTGTFQVKGVATVNGTDYEVTATVTVVPGTLKPSTSQNANTGANTLTTTGSNIAIIAIVIVLLVIAAVALFFLTKRKK